jgi:hypothetical protein
MSVVKVVPLFLMFLHVFLPVFALAQDVVRPPMSDAKGVVRVQMLARVGGASISTRSLFIFTCVKSPNKCSRYSDFVSQDNGRDLQEYLLTKMAYEDNAIFKTVRFTDSELSRKFSEFEKRNPRVWKKLKNELQVQEVEVRLAIEEISVFSALLERQESLESWVQQLRTRFKVQLFNQNAT